MGYYGLLDFGITTAVVRFISKFMGKNESEEVYKIFNNSFFLFLGLGAIVFVISVSASFTCQYFINSFEDIKSIKLIILILGFDIALSFPMRAITALMISSIRYDLDVYVQFFNIILRSTLIFIFIIRGYGLIALSVITLSSNLASYIFKIYLIESQITKINFDFSLIKKEQIVRLLNYGKHTFIAQIADILRFKLDNFVIALFLNISLVTHYSIAQSMMDYFVSLVTSAIGIFTPLFSQLDGRKDYESIKKWFLFSTKICTTLSVYIGVSIITYGDFFISRWMGNEYIDSYNILVVLCLPYVFALMQNPSVGLLYGISKHKFYSISNSCEGVLNLILSLVLVKNYGLIGVALGTAISMIFFKLIVQPIFVCRVIQISCKKYYFDALLKNLVKTLVPLLIITFLTRNILRPSYPSIITLAIIQTVICLLIYYFLILSLEERNQIRSIIGKYSLRSKKL